MRPVHALRGLSVWLRPFDEDDEEAVHAYASDPEVTRYADWGPNSREMTKSFLAEAVRRGTGPDLYSFAVISGADGELVGSASLRVVSTEHHHGELGFVVNRQHWRKGYATEAAVLLLRFSFETVGLHRVEATCHPANLASQRVLEKAGFQFEGHLRDHLLVRGEWRDSLMYAAVPDEMSPQGPRHG